MLAAAGRAAPAAGSGSLKLASPMCCGRKRVGARPRGRKGADLQDPLHGRLGPRVLHRDRLRALCGTPRTRDRERTARLQPFSPKPMETSAVTMSGSGSSWGTAAAAAGGALGSAVSPGCSPRLHRRSAGACAGPERRLTRVEAAGRSARARAPARSACAPSSRAPARSAGAGPPGTEGTSPLEWCARRGLREHRAANATPAVRAHPCGWWLRKGSHRRVQALGRSAGTAPTSRQPRVPPPGWCAASCCCARGHARAHLRMGAPHAHLLPTPSAAAIRASCCFFSRNAATSAQLAASCSGMLRASVLFLSRVYLPTPSLFALRRTTRMHTDLT